MRLAGRACAQWRDVAFEPSHWTRAGRLQRDAATSGQHGIIRRCFPED